MNDYKGYLQQKQYTQSTIKSYVTDVGFFIKWCKRNDMTPETIDYKGCLKYIKYLHQKNTTRKTVNHRLGVIKNYLNYLVEENYRSENPVENTVVKGSKRHTHYNLLEADELEDLYYSFETKNNKNDFFRLAAKRDKVMIGLMVYQGLNTTNLRTLELEHVNIYKGKIYVPSHKKMNARELDLKPWQVIELLEYIKETREEIKQRKKIESTCLLIASNNQISNLVTQIIKKLKKTNHKVENIFQIRASVITNWLSQYNLRKVQYMAGHRYISSTERYLQDDLENLHEIVNNYHPIQ